jgi:hypothetical protein
MVWDTPHFWGSTKTFYIVFVPARQKCSLPAVLQQPCKQLEPSHLSPKVMVQLLIIMGLASHSLPKVTGSHSLSWDWPLTSVRLPAEIYIAKSHSSPKVMGNHSLWRDWPLTGTIHAWTTVKIPLDLSISPPGGTYTRTVATSSLATCHQIICPADVIDPDTQGVYTCVWQIFLTENILYRNMKWLDHSSLSIAWTQEVRWQKCWEAPKEAPTVSTALENSEDIFTS